MTSRPDSIFSLFRFCSALVLLSFLSVMIWAPDVDAAMDSRFELDPQALGVPTEVSKSKTASTKTRKRVSHSRKKRGLESSPANGTIYVVKPGDNLFKVLQRDYGLSDDEAEIFIEDIRRENNIYDIRRLKIGQKIIIPALRRRTDGSINAFSPMQAGHAMSGVIGQPFRLEPPVNALTEQEANDKVRQVWERILPPHSGEKMPVVLETPTFSLTLDPQRYPIYNAMDKGKILVDQDASIPPLVKALITEKDPSVRIVSESPVNAKRFLAAMLGSAGFYSVEENFKMDFGRDPKLTVHSDFKIEKTPDCLINQDVILINSSRVPSSQVIGGFLKKEGFTVYEPYASLQPVVPVTTRQMYQITTNKPSEIIDALLASISITPDKGKGLDVFALDNNGISLSVKPERYFEFRGQRFVVTSFDGDPVTYTLFRILETKGYQVIILDQLDDFRKISEKLLSRMHIQSNFAMHTISNDTGASYSLQMSGYNLAGAGLPVAGLFWTNLVLDPVIRDLLSENGYIITTK